MADSRAHRVLRVLATLLTAASVLVALASLVLAVVNIGTPSPDFEVHRDFYPTDVLLALAYAPLGALVLLRGGHRVGWPLIGVGCGFAVTSFGLQYAVLGVSHPHAPAYEAISQLVACGWVVGTLMAMLVVPWVVTREPLRGWRLALPVVGAVLALAVGPARFLMAIPSAAHGPVVSERSSDLAWQLSELTVPVHALLGLVAVAWLDHRARQAAPDERRPLRWLMVSVLACTVSYTGFELGLATDSDLAGIAAAPLSVAMVMLAAAVFVLVLRQPSRTVDLVVSRAVVGALLTIAVVTAYVFLVWLGGRQLPGSGGAPAPLAVAALALAAMPFRAWLQRHVDRLVFGSSADAGRLLDRLGAEIEQRHAELSILEGLLDGLRRGLRLRSVAVRAADGRLQVASGPAPVSTTVRVPLRSRGQVVGELDLEASAGERLDVRTRHLVEQLSAMVAVALDLALVNADLEAARGRLVDVRQEERRLLRRELHDSLGPSLAGTSLALAAIQRSTALEPGHAALLDQLRDDLAQRSEDVRQMARVLLPPQLEDGRLGAALGQLVDRFDTARFVVTIDAEDPDSIDSGRQVALYHIAAEALLNAFRHAAARHCRILLRRVEAAVHLTVTDDGDGLPDAHASGIGLRSMRERVAELGGTFDLVSGTDGTTVTVVLP